MKLIASISALCLVAGAVLSVVIMQHQDRQDAERAVESARRSIVDMLSEAGDVIAMNRAFLGQECTPQLVRQISRSAALSPHLRGVRLLQGNLTVCASLSGTPDLPQLPEASRKGPAILLMPGDALTPSEPLLVVVQQYAEGSVAVSLNGLFLRQVLRSSLDRPGLVFRAGGMEVDAGGYVRRYRQAQQDPPGDFHFSVATDPDNPVHRMALVRESLPWLLSGLMVVILLGRGCFCWLRLWGDEDAVLRRAVLAGDIRPWYQPVVDSRTGKLAGCEVLARWHTRRRGIVMPDHFIPQAERNGLIVPLTRSLLAQVARELGPVREELPDNFHLAFNLSAAHAGDESLLRTCQLLQEALPGVVLVAEITERERIEPSFWLPALLPALRDAGVRVALDDFGTGYAGLSTLDQLPVDYIKLDRSFTTQIRGNIAPDERLLMAEMVTDIARRMNIEVVAEGVETPGQRDWLAAHGVSWLQGYLYSRPLPLSGFMRYLRNDASQRGKETETDTADGGQYGR
ncbi:EAL domain-containing protein [Enterobacter roggenkampii]